MHEIHDQIRIIIVNCSRELCVQTGNIVWKEILSPFKDISITGNESTQGVGICSGAHDLPCYCTHDLTVSSGGGSTCMTEFVIVLYTHLS